jgi:DNA invertase Pin-like site-specific DNA recombinase
LGLEAQQEVVARYLADLHTGTLCASFTEAKSGKRSDRPELARAMELCRATGATLIVAKLDRLSRDVDFLRQCVREIDGAGIVFCDLPDLPPGAAGKLVLTVMASIAEFEAGRISERTKAALQAAKARGVKLGSPRLQPGNAEASRIAREARTERARTRAKAVLPYIVQAKAAGCRTLRAIAAAMHARGVRAPSGGTAWHASTVAHVLKMATGRAPVDREVRDVFPAHAGMNRIRSSRSPSLLRVPFLKTS